MHTLKILLIISGRMKQAEHVARIGYDGKLGGNIDLSLGKSAHKWDDIYSFVLYLMTQ
jgi:hypothetical protein